MSSTTLNIQGEREEEHPSILNEENTAKETINQSL